MHQLERLGFAVLQVHQQGGPFRVLSHNYWIDSYGSVGGDEAVAARCVAVFVGSHSTTTTAAASTTTTTATSFSSRCVAELVLDLVAGACYATVGSLLPLPCLPSEFAAVHSEHFVKRRWSHSGEEKLIHLLKRCLCVCVVVVVVVVVAVTARDWLMEQSLI